MKRLSIILFIMLFACLLTVVASAKTLIFVDETGNELLTCLTEGSNDYPIESYSGNGFSKYDVDGDALTWYRKSSKTIETGVVQYIVICAKTKDIVTDNGDGILTESEIGQYSNLVSITFDANCGITEFGANSDGGGLFHRTSSDSSRYYLLFVDIPDSVTKLSDHCFRNAVRLLNVGMSENSRITDLGKASFYGCMSMKSIYIPKGVTTFKTDYEEGDQNNNYWKVGLFRNCQRLENVIFASDSKLEVIEKGAFNDCNSLETITLPNSVKTLHPRVFAKCPALEYVNFGGGLVEIIRDNVLYDEYVSMFQYTTNLKTVVLPATFKAENLADDLHTAFSISGITVYYAGTEEEFVKLQQKFALAKNGSGNGGITKATYNYISPCEAFYKGHAFDIDCTTADACQNGCGLTATNNDSHDIEKTLIFEAGITTNGTLTVVCKNKNCAPATVTVVEPVFNAKGYSTNPDKNAINGGYSVNLKSLALYEEIIGEITYGIVIANANTFGTNSFFNSEYEVNSNKALQVEMDKQYSNFDCEINFGTNTGAKLDLIITAYVITNDGVVFVQKDTGSDAKIGDTTFKSVTLAQVVALQPAVTKEY